ncbi:hypothetical protein ACS0TY_019587 [Phlomoides rotata]
MFAFRTRMWRQGANLEGDIDNFIETEQLLEFEGYMSSFLQVCFQLLSTLYWRYFIVYFTV